MKLESSQHAIDALASQASRHVRSLPMLGIPVITLLVVGFPGAAPSNAAPLAASFHGIM
jgi:hypothetical protein